MSDIYESFVVECPHCGEETEIHFTIREQNRPEDKRAYNCQCGKYFLYSFNLEIEAVVYTSRIEGIKETYLSKYHKGNNEDDSNN